MNILTTIFYFNISLSIYSLFIKMSEYETIKPKEQANGRTLVLNAEVCSS